MPDTGLGTRRGGSATIPSVLLACVYQGRGAFARMDIKDKGAREVEGRGMGLGDGREAQE